MKILDIGWILLNVGMMPKILRYLIKVSTLLSKVRFSALFRRLELKKKRDFFSPEFSMIRDTFTQFVELQRRERHIKKFWLRTSMIDDLQQFLVFCTLYFKLFLPQ